MKNTFLIIGLIILSLIIIFSYKSAFAPTQEMPKQTQEIKKSITSITIKNTTFEIELAQTAQEKEQGLSNRESLAQNKGMLFLFDTKEIHPFWMKDMNFALDMIWIADSKIVDITHSMQPPKNKNEYPAIASPKKPANKVLEINAGLSKTNGFEIGDSVIFNN